MFRSACIVSLFLGFSASGQVASGPGEPIIPGLPPDEYMDVTGDGIADLLITSRTVHVSDPQQPGYLGKYILGVRTLSGTAVLMWSTPSNQRWYTVEDSTRLDTGLLAKRIHFKQLSWTDEDHPTEFWLLERPFGPAINTDQDGWYGTGDHHDGQTMVLRSANERGTSVAAFAFELPYPYGRVVIKTKHAVRVPNGFGEEGDPEPRELIKEDPWSFGDESSEVQVIIPPGIPPDEPIDLTSDEIPDVVLTGDASPYHATEPMGTYFRGLRMMPGAALLMAKQADGSFEPFQLKMEETLTPERLAMGLQGDMFRWAEPARWREMIVVLEQRYGSIRDADEPIGWLPADGAPVDLLVFRATQYGRPMIGTLELRSETPGGSVWIELRGLVDEGEVLLAR